MRCPNDQSADRVSDKTHIDHRDIAPAPRSVLSLGILARSAPASQGSRSKLQRESGGKLSIGENQFISEIPFHLQNDNARERQVSDLGVPDSYHAISQPSCHVWVSGNSFHDSYNFRGWRLTLDMLRGACRESRGVQYCA